MPGTTDPVEKCDAMKTWMILGILALVAVLMTGCTQPASPPPATGSEQPASGTQPPAVAPAPAPSAEPAVPSTPAKTIGAGNQSVAPEEIPSYNSSGDRELEAIIQNASK